MTKQPLRIDVNLTYETCAAHLGLPVSHVRADVPITGMCLDSRVLEKGDMFFAIQAARDGHDFVPEALAKGASFVVVDKDVGQGSHADRYIKVEDSLLALQHLAQAYRNAWGGRVLGISGSNGKTTTKEIAQTLFGSRAFSTPGTWNNHLGIPLSLMMLESKHDIAILEMGVSNFGELKSYCEYSRPDVGVLTVIGDSHLMNLQNRDGVFKAKRELLDALPDNGVAVIQCDDPYLAPLQNNLHVKTLSVSTTQSQADVYVTAVGKGEVRVCYGGAVFKSEFALLGQHNLSNLACALGLALANNLPATRLQENIAKVKRFKMRMESIQTSSGVHIILDCYNANPTSTLAGMTAVSQMKGTKKILLGDMLELGPTSCKLHMDVGRVLNSYGFETVFLIGQFTRDYYQGAVLGGLRDDQVIVLEDRDQAASILGSKLQDGDVLYVKGSRGMRLEELVTGLIQS